MTAPVTKPLPISNATTAATSSGVPVDGQS
jgi:hypothetical protein